MCLLFSIVLLLENNVCHVDTSCRKTPILQTKSDFLTDKEEAWKQNFKVKCKIQVHTENFIHVSPELFLLIGVWKEIHFILRLQISQPSVESVNKNCKFGDLKGSDSNPCNIAWWNLSEIIGIINFGRFVFTALSRKGQNWTIFDNWMVNLLTNIETSRMNHGLIIFFY